MDTLFIDQDQKEYQAKDVREALCEIGAGECETLFIHSDIVFGKPGGGFKRRDYLQILYEVIQSLGVRNLIVPTFTYSFCNHERYDVTNSKTSMGAFNEYVRKIEGRYRTLDPLLSLSVPESMGDYFRGYGGNHSLGVGSGLDAVHHLDGCKFLFFGAEMADSFTYVHYVEKMLDVPYRFDMPFDGEVIHEDGSIEDRRQWIHTQCYGAKLPPKYDYFEHEMEEKGYLSKTRLGDKFVACISEKDAFEQVASKIRGNPYYFLAEPYEEKDLVHKYTYDTRNGRITHC